MNQTRLFSFFGDFVPVIPDYYKEAEFIFLANSHPDSQLAVCEGARGSQFISCDSMNLWINNNRPSLMKVLSRVNGFFCNDAEALMLSNASNLITAGRELAEGIDGFITVKKGEHGSILFNDEGLIALPAFPTEKVVDPTGAGDSFAGGFMGSLARSGSVNRDTLKEAVLYGTVMASFTVEGFGLENLLNVTDERIEQRRAKILDLLPD